MKTVIVILFCLLLFQGTIISQVKITDIEILEETISSQRICAQYDGHKHSDTKTIKLKISKKINPAYFLLSGTMFLYQNIISQQISAVCLYEITCSNYSKRMLEDYGLLKAIFLSADRLTRCTQRVREEIPEYKYNKGKVIDDPEDYLK